MIKTRFAPSPTGDLHLGSVRTALYAWLYARHHGGQFILRIEDTDTARSTAESTDAIFEGMAWLGLETDEGPYYQSQRFDRYRDVIADMLDAGQAYRCTCSKDRLDQVRNDQIAAKQKPRYDGHCREAGISETDAPHVIRFKNPFDGAVQFEDGLKGMVTIANQELDDFVMVRTDGVPTYNFAVVIDDADMAVTHVIRGDDHLVNAARQINLYQALGLPVPHFTHIPMILGSDGQRLSKRHGATNVLAYRDEGFLPEALLNYLVRLGWSQGDKEIFSREEMIAAFDFKGLNRSAACFDTEKLSWLNQHYIKTLPSDSLVPAFSKILDEAQIPHADGPDLTLVIDAMAERVKTLKEMAERSRYFFEDFDAIDEDAAKKHLRPVALAPLKGVHKALTDLPSWDEPSIKDAIASVCDALSLKLGKVAQPVRVAVTGTAMSPSVDLTLSLVGRARTLARLERAIIFVEERGKNVASAQ